MTAPCDRIAEQAVVAVRMAKEDPAQAEQLALDALELARSAGCAGAESTARRALGLAATARHQIPEAIGHLNAAVEAAERAPGTVLAAEARLSLAGALVLAGDSEKAINVLDGARGTGATAVQAASQRAVILAMLGRYEEALKAQGPAISGFRRLGERAQEGWALNNRGLLHVYTGRFGQAEADLARAEQLMVETGSPARAATYHQNRGFAAARKGDIATALALFEEADQRLRQLGAQSGARSMGRAAALLAAGLLHDARHVATETASQFREGGDQFYLSECLVLLADIALLDNDAKASRAAAEEAAQLFGRQSRPAWQSLAHTALARAVWADGSGEIETATMASAAAAHLDRMGLADQSTMAHAVAGRLWLSAGEREAGLRELDRAAASRARGTAAGRLAGWEALGVSRWQRDDRRGAMSALRRALAVVEEQQASLGATELRAHVAVHAGAAARLGLRLALETDRAQTIWLWMERHRANSLRPSPVRPPRDAVMAALLAELRGVVQDLAACATNGRDPAALLARQSELERQARVRAWADHRAPGRPGTPAPAGRPADLVAALAGTALVEMAEIDGRLHAVVVAGGRWFHRPLGPADETRRELGHARMALRRLAYGDSQSALGAGAEAQLARAGAALDRLLLGPVSSLLGERPVVVVPTAELHALPWAALPTLAHRPVAVVPSARLWLQTNPAPGWRPSPPAGRAGGGSAVIVAGPGLPGASDEVAAIGSLYPSSRVLSGPQATVAAVMAGLEGASVAHVAAHARFRADNGLWSSIELADGPLTVYELEQLRAPPGLVVLSACQSGLSTVRPGDEVMGFVTALLGLGARTVVASLAPVDDRASHDLMVAFHQRLHDGDRPAAALTAARALSPGAAGLAQVCFGAM